jgi:tRNA-specific 2-thiouridylase
MRNWDPVLSENAPESSMSLAYDSPATHSPCTWERDWADVRSVARAVGIPSDKVRLVDLSSEYWTRVFEPSVAEWDAGRTPNPDVWCNREIKFGALLKHIPEGHFLATGELRKVHTAS